MQYTRIILTAILLIIVAPIIAMGCSAGNAQVIDTQVAYTMIQSNKDNPDFVIIDIRTRDEFNSGHLANAVMIDYYSPDFKQKLGELDRSKKYLIYCKAAVRTVGAAKIMKELGFKEIYDIAGGITKWKEQGLPVVD